MQAYGEEFAGIYDLRWGGFARYIGPRLVELFNHTIVGATKPRILDLCCGAGHLARILLEEGFSVLGIDLSPAMLEWAKARNRAFITAGLARFEVGDARDFEVTESFGIVVSTFDAMNHLDSLDELGSAFRCVHRALVDGGHFVFDINTRKGLEHWNGLEVDESRELTIISRGVFGSNMSRAYTHVSGFRRRSEQCYTRFEETVYNTVFQVTDVVSALSDAGFSDVRLTHDSDFTVDLVLPEQQERVFFIAKR
jgi:SAM-dependent methyltransferase